MKNYISDLGDPALNSFIWPLWAVAMSLLALMLFPISFYYYRQLSDEVNASLRIGMFFLVLSDLGLLGAGVIPQSLYTFSTLVHVMNAGFFMGGAFMNLFFWYPLLQKVAGFNRNVGFFRLGFGIFIAIGICSSMLVPTLSGLITLFEWGIMLMILVNHALLLIYLPERVI